MIAGDLKTIKDLDRVFSESCELVKDSSKSGNEVYTKVYSMKGNPVFKKIRIFFNKRERRGTIKIRNYLPTYLGICTFTLIQVAMLMKESITNLIEVI